MRAFGRGAFARQVKLHTEYHRDDMVLGARFQPMVRTGVKGAGAVASAARAITRVSVAALHLAVHPPEGARSGSSNKQKKAADVEAGGAPPPVSVASSGAIDGAEDGPSTEPAAARQLSKAEAALARFDSRSSAKQRVEISIDKLDEYEIAAPPGHHARPHRSFKGIGTYLQGRHRMQRFLCRSGLAASPNASLNNSTRDADAAAVAAPPPPMSRPPSILESAAGEAGASAVSAAAPPLDAERSTGVCIGAAAASRARPESKLERARRSHEEDGVADAPATTPATTEVV